MEAFEKPKRNAELDATFYYVCVAASLSYTRDETNPEINVNVTASLFDFITSFYQESRLTPQ